MATIRKEIAGQMVEIHLSEQDGTFSWRSANGALSADATTLSALSEQVKKHLTVKRITVNIPVGILEGHHPENIRLRRFSEKDHTEILVSAIDGGKHEPVRKYNDAYQLWDDASVAELARLVAIVREAERALDAFRTSRLLDPRVASSSTTVRAKHVYTRAQTIDTLLEKALAEKEKALEAKAEVEALKKQARPEEAKAFPSATDPEVAKRFDLPKGDDYGPNPGDVGDL